MTGTTRPSTPAAGAAPPDGEPPVRGPRLGLFSRLGSGEAGVIQVVIGLAIIWTIFQVANSNFLTAGNLTNLMLQITAVGMISIGVVLVLLLGEIDLSVGSVSGLAASICVVLNVNQGMDASLAIALGVGAGLAVGLFHGLVITQFGVPSFVVTLAGLLGWQGAQLYVLGSDGSINLPDGTITGLTTTFFTDQFGLGLAAVAVALYAAIVAFGRVRRARVGLPSGSPVGAIVRVVVVAVAVFAAVIVMNNDRGLPLAVVIFVGFLVVFDYVTRRTRFGRHVFAVGGNSEAARRAGIRVASIKVAVFGLASTMAAIGGILAASRLLAVNQSSGSGDLLLNAIAGPVVAGTSLFGGRGTVWSALLGALVIGSISNGMDLLALESSIKFMITGAVLLAAVVLEAAGRKRRAAAGVV